MRTALVDTTFPKIVFMNIANSSYNNTGIIINVSISDANLDTSFWSNDSWITNYTTFNISTSGWLEQEHLIRVFVNDSAGNVNTSILNVTLDNTPPTYRSLSYSSSITEGNTQTININATDINLDSVWVEIYNGETGVRSNHSMNLILNDTYNWSGTWIVTTDRIFNLTIYINDSAGNLNATSELSFSVLAYVPPVPGGGSGSGGGPVPVAKCGNGICEFGESPENCPDDCRLVWANASFRVGTTLISRLYWGGEANFTDKIVLENPGGSRVMVTATIGCVENDPSCKWLWVDLNGTLTQEAWFVLPEGNEESPGLMEVNVIMLVPENTTAGAYTANLLFESPAVKHAVPFRLENFVFLYLPYLIIIVIIVAIVAFLKWGLGQIYGASKDVSRSVF